MNTKPQKSIEVSTDGCTGCGCLLLGLGGSYVLYKTVMWTAGKVNDLIQEVPGGYVTVIGSAIILRVISNSRKKANMKPEDAHMNGGKGRIIDVEVEILEPKE